MIDPKTLRKLIRQGLTTAEIAAHLGESTRTVQRARAAAGLAQRSGRPATGVRPQLPSPRVDVDVLEAVEREAEVRGSSPADVVEDVVTTWARG